MFTFMEIAIVKIFFSWILLHKGLFFCQHSGDSQYLLFDSEMLYLFYNFSFPKGWKSKIAKLKLI